MGTGCRCDCIRFFGGLSPRCLLRVSGTVFAVREGRIDWFVAPVNKLAGMPVPGVKGFRGLHKKVLRGSRLGQVHSAIARYQDLLSHILPYACVLR